jgi:pimeloyl-ACP methyl ester carboxylesterase
MEPLAAPSRRDQIAMALLAHRQNAANAQVSGGSDRVPLVCIDIEYLQGKLEADRPVICFLNMSVFPHRFSTVEELARHFITEFRAIRPEGPVHLCGYCFGAIVALEMARLLDERGERIESLVLMEPGYPGKQPLVFRAWHRALRMIRKPLELARNASAKREEPSPGGDEVALPRELLTTMDNAVATHAFRPFRGRATILAGRESERRFIHKARWRRLVGGVDLSLVSGNHGARFFSEDLVTFFRHALDR